jgi:hypothetical protein
MTANQLAKKLMKSLPLPKQRSFAQEASWFRYVESCRRFARWQGAEARLAREASKPSSSRNLLSNSPMVSGTPQQPHKIQSRTEKMSIQKLYAMLEQAKRERLYGEISFCFRNGTLTFIKRQQTIDPTKDSDNGHDADNPHK